jgi:hypothetical protein
LDKKLHLLWCEPEERNTLFRAEHKTPDQRVGVYSAGIMSRRSSTLTTVGDVLSDACLWWGGVTTPPDLRRLRSPAIEAEDAAGRDDGATHASSRLRHEGQGKAISEATMQMGSNARGRLATSSRVWRHRPISSFIDKARKVIGSSARYREALEFIAL